jgi:hypothetical protein
MRLPPEGREPRRPGGPRSRQLALAAVRVAVRPMRHIRRHEPDAQANLAILTRSRPFTFPARRLRQKGLVQHTSERTPRAYGCVGSVARNWEERAAWHGH